MYIAIYGVVEFKNPLTPCEVAMINELTDREFDVGETEIEFWDAHFSLEEFCDWLEKKEVVSGKIEDCGDYEYAWYFDGNGWVYEEKGYLHEASDDTLIAESKGERI